MIILYSTGCPKCAILEKKLNDAGIAYTTKSDVDEMLAMGIRTVPYLDVDGELLDFAKAVKYVNERIG